MAGKSRVLRLILLSLLSFGVLPPVAAQAFVFAAPRYALLEGEAIGPSVFAAGGIEKECKEAHFNGTYHRRTLEIEPVYGECVAKALTGLPAEYVQARCVYRLHAGASRPGRKRWKASVDLDCPTTYSMQWHIYEDTKHYLEAPVCTTAMFPQAGVGTAELSNVAGSPHKIAIQWNLNSIKYKVMYGSALFCGSLPGVVVKGEAFYRGRSTIGAIDLGEAPLPLAVRG